MAGIGEATAIIGVVQVGISLAITLNSYVSEVKDAQEDILELANDIDSTLLQLRDLGKLIQQNDTTKAWTEVGVKLAHKCVRDCEKVIGKLRKLLKKSTASASSDQVTRDEIDVKKFEKALWPLYKPELLVRKQELRSIKQDILIAYAAYNANAGATEMDRQRAKDDIPRLRKTRAMVQKQIKDAKSQRQSHRARRRPIPKPNSGRGPPADYVSARVPRPSSETSLEEGFFYDTWDDVEADFEMWREEEELLKKRAAGELKEIEAKAVEKWRKSQAEEIEARQRQIEEERMKLSKALQAKGMADREIATMLDKLYPLVHLPVDVQALIPSPESVTSEQSRPSSKSSRRSSIWSRLSKSGRSSTSQTSSTTGEQTPAIPKLLQDPWAEDGVAQLKAYYYQRMLGHQGDLIREVAVELPAQWLLDTLIHREETSRKDPRKFDSIWRAFSVVPDDYRYFILNDLDDPEDDDSKWVLVYLECVQAEGKRRLLGRRSRDETIGVYVVMKKNRKSPGRPITHVRDNKGTFENEEIVITTNPETRRLSSRSRSVAKGRSYHDDIRRSSNRRYAKSRSPSPEPYGHGASYAMPYDVPPPHISMGSRSRERAYNDDEYVVFPDRPAADGGPRFYDPSRILPPSPRPLEESRAFGRNEEREFSDRYSRERTSIPHPSRGGNLSGTRYGSSFLPPQRQDSNDSYYGRKRGVHFGDTPVRRDTNDTMDSYPSQADYSHRQRRDDYYDERPRYRDRNHELDAIVELMEESVPSTSGSSSSSETEEEKDLYGLDDQTLQERLLKEYTKPIVPASDGTDPQRGSSSVEQNQEGNDDSGPAERSMTESPAPLHPDDS